MLDWPVIVGRQPDLAIATFSSVTRTPARAEFSSELLTVGLGQRAADRLGQRRRHRTGARRQEKYSGNAVTQYRQDVTPHQFHGGRAT